MGSLYMPPVPPCCKGTATRDIWSRDSGDRSTIEMVFISPAGGGLRLDAKHRSRGLGYPLLTLLPHENKMYPCIHRGHCCSLRTHPTDNGARGRQTTHWTG